MLVVILVHFYSFRQCDFAGQLSWDGVVNNYFETAL